VRSRAPYLRPVEAARPLGPRGGARFTRRRRRGLRGGARWVFLALALLGTAGLAEAGWNFVRSDGAFSMRRLQVVGVRQNDPAEVRRALDPLTGRNLLALGSDEVAARLAPCPWVEGFLCRKTLPDTLIVEVRERGQRCVLSTAGGPVAVDGEGHAWRVAAGSAAAFALETGADPADPELQRMAVALLEAGLQGQVKSLGREAGGGWHLVTPDGWTLVASSQDVPGQWAKYVRARPWVAAYLPDRKKVDLRWSGRAVLAPPPPAAGGETDG